MTLQDCIDNKRWAESMLEETKGLLAKRWNSSLVEQYYYLQSWIEKFDRSFSHFTCYPEHHCNYQKGFEYLKKLSANL